MLTEFGNDDSVGTYNWPLGVTLWRLVVSPGHTPEISPRFHRGPINFGKKQRLRLLLAKSDPSLKVEGTPSSSNLSTVKWRKV